MPAANEDCSRRDVDAVAMPIVVEFVSTLNAPPELVWDRVASVSGANKEVWPLARMTRPSFEDRMTPKEPGSLPPFRTWFLIFGFVPIARRSVQYEVLEEGRFIETSTSWLLGTQQHERSVTDSTGESTVLTDRLTSEPRGKWADAFNKASVSATFHMRHRRLRRHFNTHA